MSSKVTQSVILFCHPLSQSGARRTSTSAKGGGGKEGVEEGVEDEIQGVIS